MNNNFDFDSLFSYAVNQLRLGIIFSNTRIYTFWEVFQILFIENKNNQWNSKQFRNKPLFISN
jgi:hypothetical protein